MQPLWRPVWRFFTKLKIEAPHDPVTALLGIHPNKTIIQKDTCTPTRTAALFTNPGRGCNLNVHRQKNRWRWGTRRRWNITQPWKGMKRCHWQDVDGPRARHTECTKSRREKQISCKITHACSLEKWRRWTYSQRRNRVTDAENKLMVTKGGQSGWDKLGDCCFCCCCC